MPSNFDQFANEFVASSMIEQFSERTETGDLAVLKYQPPGNADPFDLPGVILSETSGQLVENTSGDIVGRDTRTAMVGTASMLAEGVDKLQYGATVTLPDGETWPVEIAQSKWHATFVTLQLEREPLYSMERYEQADGTV